MEDETYRHYAFVDLNNIELLERIKKEISNYIEEYHNNTINRKKFDANMNNIWYREYGELHKRLLKNVNKANMNRNIGKFGQIKREKTYRQLQKMSKSTKVADDDHDMAVFLLDSFFPDNRTRQSHSNTIQSSRNLLSDSNRNSISHNTKLALYDSIVKRARKSVDKGLFLKHKDLKLRTRKPKLPTITPMHSNESNSIIKKHHDLLR